MNIDFEQLKGLLELVSQNDISELTVESGQDRITVKKPVHPSAAEFTAAPYMVAPPPWDNPAGHSPSSAPPAAGHGNPPLPIGHGVSPVHERHGAAAAYEGYSLPVSQELPGQPGTLPDNKTGQHLVKITSPMVGTFYRSASPSKPPFVEVGDVITAGQTICIIEAMKLMNDLPSEVSGRIVEISASNGATVEYGQPLFLIDPGT